MPQYIAFLRGINLGNRRVKMDELARLFVKLKYTDVATFIASGNVIFTTKATDDAKLTAQIQAHLAKELGYEVDTFVRTRAEVAAVAEFKPFAAVDMDHPDHTLHAGFLSAPLPAAQAKALEACRSEVDAIKVSGREYYWLCRIKSNESKLWTSKELKAVKLPSSSMRNMTTIRKLAALYRAT